MLDCNEKIESLNAQNYAYNTHLVLIFNNDLLKKQITALIISIRVMPWI